MVYNNCEKSIWYYGFIGSMNFDEFGFLLYAAGNIKGVLYRNFHVVLELNSNNVFNELKKYVNNDTSVYRYNLLFHQTVLLRVFHLRQSAV